MPQLTCSDEHIYARTLHGKYVYKNQKIIVQPVKEKSRKNNKEPHVRLPGQRTARLCMGQEHV